MNPFDDLKIETQVNLAPMTWWKIGGHAQFYCAPKTIEQSLAVINWALSNQHKITVLGGGSNVLIPDEGIPGLVFHTHQLTGIEYVVQDQKLIVTARAGTPKSDLTKLMLQNKLAPAHFLCGLPGDIGGGVVMNAGVGEMIIPREFVEIVNWIDVIKWDTPPTQNFKTQSQAIVQRFQKDEIEWQYRHTQGWQPGVIVQVGLSWPMVPDTEVMARVRQSTQKRRLTQPLEWPSCGSTFRNPPGEKAGALIEKAGFKGVVMGGAQVSEKHANFIINRGGATAKDVKELIERIQKKVKDQTGIDLQTEVQFL